MVGLYIRCGYSPELRLRPGDRVLLRCEVVGEVSSDFPGWLRARFTDAADREWHIVDKAPIFGTD